MFTKQVFYKYNFNLTAKCSLSGFIKLSFTKKLLNKAIIVFIFCNFLSCKRTYEIRKLNFKTITVFKEERTIFFDAKINPMLKEPYFLFCFRGYPWLENLCVFSSESKLQELQTAFALIDWETWDKIYTQGLDPNFEVFIKLENDNWQNITQVINIENINKRQIIFIGSPFYDPIVLSNNYKNSRCSTCNLLPLEQNLFLAGFNPLRYKFLKEIKEQKHQIKIIFKK